MMEPRNAQADEIFRPIREYCYSLILTKESTVDENYVDLEHQRLEVKKIKISPFVEDLSSYESKKKTFP